MDRAILSPFTLERGVVAGHYRAAGFTAAIAPASNAVLANVRWVAGTAGTGAPGTASFLYPKQAPQFMVPLHISAQVTVASAVTAQRNDPLAAFVARAYTASESVNVTAVTLTGNNAKMNTQFASCQLGSGQYAVASAAAGLSGGAKTVDANPFGVAGFEAGALVGLGTGTFTMDLYRASIADNEYPLVLANNEGFVVQWGATALATGTVVVAINVEWMEVVNY